jgi:hypothetical protein
MCLCGDHIFNDHELNIVPATPFELEKNEYVQMSLYFVPDIPGTYAGIITITSNDPDEPVKKIALSGIAVEEAAPQLSVSPDTLYFSESITQLGGTISNTGIGILEWTVTGDIPDEWLYISPMAGSTTPEAPTVLTVEVDFGVVEPGMGHTILITSNGGDAEIDVILVFSVSSVPHGEIST